MRRVLLILALIPAAAFAQPREYYGAIAYSPRSSAHGWSNDHPSRPDAEKAALANCRKFAKDCRALVSFKNACGALAVGSKGYGWASGHTEGSAGIEAMKNCSQHSLGCSVHRLVCTTR
jgi:serine/threonine-protein kinase